MKNQLLPATFLFFILAVANFACESEKPQSNSQSSADATYQEEMSLSVLSSQFVLSKIETPELIRNFFTKEGFTQISVEQNVYWLAGFL